MRAFRGPGAPGAIAAIALAVSPPTAAQAPDRDAAPPGTGLLVQEVAPGNGSLLAGLGDHVFGPIDVETPTGDNGCLGVEAAFGFFYPSSPASTGSARRGT